jgi:hypothetical protein
MPHNSRLRIASLLLSLLSPLALLAQEMSVYSGKGEVTQAIDGDAGAVFDIGGGVTITFPKGLPVGHSRILTFKKAKKKPNGADVKQGFVPLGPALELSIPLNASARPIVLAMSAKKNPASRKQRLVLAMEIGTLCNDDNQHAKLKNGLCAGWELGEARYDDATQRVIAELSSTGGMRMAFGLVPADE